MNGDVVACGVRSNVAHIINRRNMQRFYMHMFYEEA